MEPTISDAYKRSVRPSPLLSPERNLKPSNLGFGSSRTPQTNYFYSTWRTVCINMQSGGSKKRAVLKHGLQYIDGRIDNDKLAKLGLNAEENVVLTYNLDKMPSFDEAETKSAKHRSWPILPSIKVQYDKRSFRMFGLLATIDWECFDVENVPWHLPSTDDYDEFVDEVQSSGGAALTDSDGEQRKLVSTIPLSWKAMKTAIIQMMNGMTSVGVWMASTTMARSAMIPATILTMQQQYSC
jgi:hypothetical protein